MNKKVDEEFKNIHNEYLLQCICTEMKDKINSVNELLKYWDKLELDDLLATIRKIENLIKNESGNI